MAKRSFRGTTSLKRTALAAVVLGALAVVAYTTLSHWAPLIGWDDSVAQDMLTVVAFFVGSLLLAGAVIAALEARRNGERWSWRHSSIDPPSESSP